MSVRSGQSTARESDLGSAIREFRDVVERKLRKHGVGADDLDALRRALEELNAGWDELSAQSEYLARERAYYVELFRLAPEAYVVTDSSGAIREVNDSAQRLLRLATPFLAGKPLQLFVAPEHRAEFRAQLSALLAREPETARSWSGALRRNEGPLAVKFTASAVQGAEGVARVCWVLRPGEPA